MEIYFLQQADQRACKNKSCSLYGDYFVALKEGSLFAEGIHSQGMNTEVLRIV
jgi:ABC-type enterochelin transport system ATPase subunit